MENRNSSFLSDIIAKNIKTIATGIVFICGFYAQYQASMMKIEQMEKEIATIKIQLNDQYVKLDNMKLDKAVFEATMKQFTDMSADIRQIRDRLEDMLGENNYRKVDRK